MSAALSGHIWLGAAASRLDSFNAPFLDRFDIFWIGRRRESGQEGQIDAIGLSVISRHRAISLASSSNVFAIGRAWSGSPANLRHPSHSPSPKCEDGILAVTALVPPTARTPPDLRYFFAFSCWAHWAIVALNSGSPA